jgi:hypothetical protein
MPSWKVLYVQGRCEFKVEQQLARLGIEHYTPQGRVHDPSGFPAEPKRLKRKTGQNQSRYIGREYRNTGGSHRQKIRSVKTRKSIHGFFGRNTCRTIAVELKG